MNQMRGTAREMRASCVRVEPELRAIEVPRSTSHILAHAQHHVVMRA